MKLKQFLVVPFLFLVSLLSCNGQEGPALQPKEFSEQCYAENAILVDVRTPQEYADGHLKGSVQMDYLGDNFNEQLKTLDKNKSIYLYCRSGGRSGNTQEELIKQGYKHVYNLDGGVDAWKKTGLPVEK
jgi:rhodanese-related sulfurtransferase